MVFEFARVPLGSLWLAYAFLAVYGFNFSASVPGQCDPLKVSWSGGRPPFQLLVVPPGGIIRNISVPVSAFDYDSKNGAYSVQQLDLPQGVQVMLSMSDATGIFAGGTSRLMTVSASHSGQVCNTTDPANDFYFSLDSTLAQCSPYPFTHYEGAVLPVSILVHIPEGQSFVVHPPSDDSFTWSANLTAGTPAAFSVYDAHGRVGGTSSVRVVQFTNDTSCLSTTTDSSNSGGRHVKVGLAIGISIGILGLLFAYLVGFCYYRQSRQHGTHFRPASSFVDLTHDPDPYNAPVPAHPLVGHRPTSLAVSVIGVATDSISVPGSSQSSSRVAGIGRSSSYQLEPFLVRSPQTSSHPRSSKWSVQNQDTSDAPTSITYPSGVVVHTDIFESLDGPLEIPPQYSENRPPLPGFPNSPMRAQIRDSV